MSAGARSRSGAGHPARTWSYQRSTNERSESTKSKRVRSIPLPAVVLADLQSLRLVHHRLYGRLPKASDPIFLSPWGKRLGKHDNALRLFDKVIERDGIEKRDAHLHAEDLRGAVNRLPTFAEPEPEAKRETVGAASSSNLATGLTES